MELEVNKVVTVNLHVQMSTSESDELYAALIQSQSLLPQRHPMIQRLLDTLETV